MRRWHSPIALAVLVLLLVGAGWSSKHELGITYRTSYVNVSAGDTVYFPKETYGVRNLGLGGGSAVADSSRSVNWIWWSIGTSAGTCSLAIYCASVPGGVDTVLATTNSFLASGMYGGARGISKVAVLSDGSGTMQITGSD